MQQTSTFLSISFNILVSRVFTFCDLLQWKKMFAERFLLRQNWLNGKCKVRTFEGHAQGRNWLVYMEMEGGRGWHKVGVL